MVSPVPAHLRPPSRQFSPLNPESNPLKNTNQDEIHAAQGWGGITSSGESFSPPVTQVSLDGTANTDISGIHLIREGEQKRLLLDNGQVLENIDSITNTQPHIASPHIMVTEIDPIYMDVDSGAHYKSLTSPTVEVFGGNMVLTPLEEFDDKASNFEAASPVTIPDDQAPDSVVETQRSELPVETPVEDNFPFKNSLANLKEQYPFLGNFIQSLRSRWFS